MNIQSIARERASASILRYIVNGNPVNNVRRERERLREHSEHRREQHRQWDRSPAGKASMRERGKRYRATGKGKANARKKSLAYYARHKDDPIFKARKKGYEQAFRARRKARRLAGEYTFHLIGQTITTALFAA